MKKKINSILPNKHLISTYVANNFDKLRLSYLFAPFFLLLLIVFFLYTEDAFSVNAYVNIQKNLFFYLNFKLSHLPNLQFNITQLGDVLIFLPFLAIFMVYAPKFWESLLISLLVSCIFSNVLKKLFAVPRPAAMLDNDKFEIIGKALCSFTSLPSGHSIAAFTILISVLFAFMPQKVKFKLIWIIFIFMTGLIIVFTRVGIGAHYPLDVIIGSLLGYLSAILGIFINRKFKLLTWLTNKKYYYVSIFLFSIWAVALINKIVTLNLAIFYFSLASLVATLFIITNIYVKKQY